MSLLEGTYIASCEFMRCVYHMQRTLGAAEHDHDVIRRHKLPIRAISARQPRRKSKSPFRDHAKSLCHLLGCIRGQSRASTQVARRWLAVGIRAYRGVESVGVNNDQHCEVHTCNSPKQWTSLIDLAFLLQIQQPTLGTTETTYQGTLLKLHSKDMATPTYLRAGRY